MTLSSYMYKMQSDRENHLQITLLTNITFTRVPDSAIPLQKKLPD